MPFDRITSEPDRMNGQPCIRNLRLTVRRVLEAMATYPDREELRREYPELEDETSVRPWNTPPRASTIRPCPCLRAHETASGPGIAAHRR